MASGKQLKVAVIGSTGYAGSHACIELLSRGHLVSGVSRNPDKIGTHPHYTGIPIDLETASIAQIVDAFTGHDVVVKYLFIAVSFINLQHIRPTYRRRKPSLQYYRPFVFKLNLQCHTSRSPAKSSLRPGI